MNTFPGIASARRSLWLFSLFAFLSLTACAISPAGEMGSQNAGGVDVGYGTVDEEHLSGSVETVQGDDGKVERQRTLGEMLARIPGVQVTEQTGTLRVRIRGENSSFISGQDPLFLVDGTPVPGAGLTTMNPNTIESITVLKNAGDTAIYGARGANGVILIKTKRDK